MNPEIMKQAGFEKELEKVRQGICPFCNRKVDPLKFQDESSRKEFTISGLCQSCQNEFFG